MLQNLLKRHKISCIIPDRPHGTVRDHFTISIEQQEGFDTLRKKLSRKLKFENDLERVGIIVDADDPTDPSVNIRNR